MAKFTVTVTEVFCKAVEIDTCDAETAEALVRGEWDQGQHDLSGERNTFDHVEFDVHAQTDRENEVDDGTDHDVRR